MNNMKKLVQYIREDAEDKRIQVDFSSMCYKGARDLEKEINYNGCLANYSLVNGFIFY